MTESPSATGGMRRKPRQARSQERVNRIIDVAEELFITQGYDATTTNAIAARAQIPIGSLYQFFPDKTAIMQALVMRYEERLHQRLAVLDNPELPKLPLSIMVDQMIDITDQFLSEHPGYYAIYMEAQGVVQEIGDAADAELIRDLASLLAQRGAGSDAVDSNVALNPESYETIAFVVVKAISTLIWLSFSQEPSARQRLIAETKRFTLSYLQSYFPSEASGG